MRQCRNYYAWSSTLYILHCFRTKKSPSRCLSSCMCVHASLYCTHLYTWRLHRRQSHPFGEPKTRTRTRPSCRSSCVWAGIDSSARQVVLHTIYYSRYLVPIPPTEERLCPVWSCGFPCNSRSREGSGVGGGGKKDVKQPAVTVADIYI